MRDNIDHCRGPPRPPVRPDPDPGNARAMKNEKRKRLGPPLGDRAVDVTGRQRK